MDPTMYTPRMGCALLDPSDQMDRGGGGIPPPCVTFRLVGRGGEPRHPTLQGAQPMPSHCLPDAKCQPQWHL